MAHHIPCDIIAFALALAMCPFDGRARKDILTGKPLTAGYMPYVDVARGASCMRAVREGRPLKWRAINRATLENLLVNARAGRPVLTGDANDSCSTYMVELTVVGAMTDSPHVTGNLARLGFTPYACKGAVHATTWRTYRRNLKWLNVFDTLELLEFHGVITVYVGHYYGDVNVPSWVPNGFTVCKHVSRELKIKWRFTTADDARRRCHYGYAASWGIY